MIEEEKVRVPSKKKYNCKRNKGEHEYLEPTILYNSNIRYVYKVKNGGIMFSNEQHPEYKYIRTELSIALECICKHCGHKAISFMTDKII